MVKVRIARLLCGGVLALSPVLGHALTSITDNPNDFLPTFAGSTSSTDLDVIDATVLYDATTDRYSLSATMSGAIGSTKTGGTDPTGLYVWGVNRGAGTASFAADGITGVRFDRVVILNPDGTGSVAGVGDLPAGSVTIAGNTISAVISGSFLPSTGFNKIDYTWNLWPRDGFFPFGFTQIADFAPDNANFTTTPGVVVTPGVAVPEPQTYLLMLAGLAIAGWATRRRAGS